jgi:hypothetical protein
MLVKINKILKKIDIIVLALNIPKCVRLQIEEFEYFIDKDNFN